MDIQAAFCPIMPEVISGALLTDPARKAALSAVGMSAAEVESFEYSYTAGILLLQQLGVGAAWC